MESQPRYLEGCRRLYLWARFATTTESTDRIEQLMTTPILDRYIDHTPGVAGGKVRIAGRRITVTDIAIWYERLGRSADEISSEYDLTLAEVYAALAYYHDHRAEIDEALRTSDVFVEGLKQQIASKLPGKLGGG